MAGLLFSKSHNPPQSSAPVPLFVNFVGGLDAESGRPQPSKPKVCELVGFGVGGLATKSTTLAEQTESLRGGRGRVLKRVTLSHLFLFRVFVCFSCISCDELYHPKQANTRNRKEKNRLRSSTLHQPTVGKVTPSGSLLRFARIQPAVASFLRKLGRKSIDLLR